VRPPIDRDNSRFVNHLVAKNHIARRLQNLVALIVGVGNDRSHRPARDAAVPQAFVLPGIVATAGLRRARPRSSCRRTLGREFLRFRSQRRNLAIGGIDDQRGLVVRLPTIVPIERRTDADSVRAGGGCISQPSAIGIAPRDVVHRLLGIDIRLVLCTRLPLRVFVLGEGVASSEIARTLQRGADHVRTRPDALEVGIAPGRFGRGVRLGGLRRRRGARPGENRQTGKYFPHCRVG
jgi:hypothetical protein